jgi:L-seryl-tRNA(Ser) seleniumtransferase
MASLAALPSVERLLRHPDCGELITGYGRLAVLESIRRVLEEVRSGMRADRSFDLPSDSAILERVSRRLVNQAKPSLRPVFNLSGTVLHTNLGRAPLPEVALEAVTLAARDPSNLEYDLATGRRGDRDSHVEAQLCSLTGAEAATVVNNNAAAVLLVLNTLAMRKEVPVSRGELIEIGGSFRMPDIMARSGCRLREVGTTNRTHFSDYQAAIGSKTGLVLKVHTSNYSIEGFTASVPETDLARLCHERGVPLVVDLGSGTLVDLRNLGLPHEPTPYECLSNGADLVTFSGDKLLGGPQAGIVVGRRDLVEKMKRNPLKRALRVDKLTIAALAAVLALYRNPERLAQRLPVLRALTRTATSVRESAERLRLVLDRRLSGTASVEVIECESQIGSGALPTQRIPSAGLAIRPVTGKRGAGAALERLAAAFRNLPGPVIGRIQGGALILDLRCLEDEAGFMAQLADLDPAP